MEYFERCDTSLGKSGPKKIFISRERNCRESWTAEDVQRSWDPSVLGPLSSGTPQFWDPSVLGPLSSGTPQFWDPSVLGPLSSGTPQFWDPSVLGPLSSGTPQFWDPSVLANVSEKLGPLSSC
ncbi:hypothetical protein ACOMHN_035531 [Nucella lapillus]